METTKRLATRTEAVQEMNTPVRALDGTDERFALGYERRRRKKDVSCMLPNYKYYKEGVYWEGVVRTRLATGK
jgi:hypothetical protein